ncbi:MAG: hypothetical protein ABL886_09195, partial [Rhodoglobus sp.]
MAHDSPLIEAALDLAWSHWTGLGVRGAVTAPDTAVDPEALIHLTAALADLDPRLRDEAWGWWSRYSDHVSQARMTQIGSRFDKHVRSNVDGIITLYAAKSTGQPSTKARLDDLEHPARSLLRLRCAFGANARAEILLALLTDWANVKDGVTALTLAEVGYSKRNIATVMEDLTMSGLVVATPDANRVRYRLAQPDVLRRLLAPLPRVGGRWHLRMPLIARFVHLAARLRGKDAMVQAVEARKVLSDVEPEAIALGLDLPRIATAESYWDGVQRWVIDEVIHVPADGHRELAGQLVGTWIGPGDEPQPAAQPTGAVLPPVGVDAMADRELRCLDLVQVSTIDPPGDWRWMVLSEAAIDTYQHIVGIRRGERWRFSTKLHGAARTYLARMAPALPPDHIASLYGADAAERVRRDRAAVRIHLTLES